jgi:hypothetical protein
MCWIVSTEEILVEKPDETTATKETWRNAAGLLTILVTEWLDGLLLVRVLALNGIHRSDEDILLRYTDAISSGDPTFTLLFSLFSCSLQ